ncbi:MAG: sel1 repeat family protein [Veillonella sp.]|uniref:sel1 repeat family protein n=1 Tax=Veillonella sp. TaxID=1926307 RepID=UPI0028FF355B|nr:sel1 repeat family protein [Veillonella sp.]MDU1130274.1 sel1 repeat family protein [Veillonella sp.]
MSFYFTDQIQQSFNKIFHQCNKDIAWEGKAELDALVKLDEEGQKIPGIGDVYAILARVYSGPQFTWIEAGFPEDDTKAYSYLHTAIRKGSAIAILQAMRTSGALTPTIEKELPMTKDQAFQRVYEGAQKGCSYCAYAIANVYQWGDYHILPSAQKVANEGEPSSFVRFLKGLFAQADQRRFANKITAIAQQWLRKSAEAGLVIAYRNLRITYVEQNNSVMEEQVIFEGAAAGLPLMMYLAGDICKSRGEHERALEYFERGAAMNNGMCLREAAEYYAKPCESNKRIPQNIQKALKYYERAAISPDYLDFNDHAYVTMQAIILRTLNIDGQSQDWSRIAHLLQQPAIYTLDAIWPYLAYVFTFKKGNSPAVRTAIECVNQAGKCFDRYGSYDYADHLWQLAAGYCYEIGAITKEPDLDQAVTFYEHARESIRRLNTRNDNWLGTGEPLAIPDEASERLEAFELVDGHYQYKEGITQSSTTCNPMPPAWPQNSVDVLEIFEDSTTGWRTNKYDWPFIEREWDTQKYLSFIIYDNRQSIENVIYDVYSIVMFHNEDKNTCNIYLYGYSEDPAECDETLEPTIYEIRDFKEMSISEGLRLIKEFYDHATLPVIDESWEKQYKNTTPPREYVLTCDNDIFYLNQYELSNQMIKDALEGVANGTYDIIAVRPSNLDDPGISYFIERGKGKNLHIRLYITTEDDIGDEIVYGFERDSSNLTSINYWIQESITSNKLPDLSDWEEVKKKD